MTAHFETPSSSPHRRRRRIYVLIALVAIGIAGVFIWRGYGEQRYSHTNRLSDEISPYLLLHAHNPVDWYPWGPEALERAKREQKPIFLSVGYSTCYWCHVMERQVFSNPDIAALMNEHFINIKVDREERPDLDEVYMTATQLMTTRGGWPNSVFLTPDLKPFYAGTYFPPTDMPGRPGFPRILLGLNEAWKTRRDEVLKQAEEITDAIRNIQNETFVPTDTVTVDRALVDRAITYLTSRYDVQNGGFGGAPKFPPALPLELLLTDYQRTRDPQTLSIATHTLDAMARGGMYDHMGGGFHRYSTDARWRVPHFEKMLYNQSDLTRVYLLAYRITGNEAYRRVAEDILAYVAREMTGDGGAFYSAMDSETDAVEGIYYLWTEPEIRNVLGGDADLFFRIYALAPMPEDEGGVLYMTGTADDIAPEYDITPDRLRNRVASMKLRLLEVRARRKRPLVDTKMVTAWNGLMIDAYAYAYDVTGNPKYRDNAIKAANFLLRHLRTDDGILMRTYRDGTVKYNGYQEDYAFLIRGLLRLHAVTGEARWRLEAMALTERMTDTFWDDKNGGFFFTDGSEALIVRMKNPYDASMPSGNAVAAHALLELAHSTGNRAYLYRTQRLFKTFAGQMENRPVSFTHLFLALDTYLATDWASLPGVGTIDNGWADRQNFLPLQPVQSTALSSGQTVVHATLSLSTPEPAVDQSFDAIIRIRVEPGWHINAMPPLTKDLIPTTVTFNADVPVEVVSIAYPPGRMETFVFTDEPLSIYQDAVTIRATLIMKSNARPDASSRLRATLTYQACSEEVCLAPEEALLSIALRGGIQE